MSRGLNKVMLIGNIGREPEMRFTATGKPVTSFSLAVSRQWINSSGNRREETEWFNVVVWGNLAEICDQYIKKGRQVYVEGRLQTRNWEDEYGRRQYRTDVIAREVTILGKQPRPYEHNHQADLFASEEYSETNEPVLSFTEYQVD